MKLTDFPQYFPLEEYRSSIGRVLETLKNTKGVESVYQIGGISDPGISDVDLVVVFSNDASCNYNPLKSLGREERYFFTHKLYGASVTDFMEAQNYTFFHNYNLLWGKKLLPSVNSCFSSKEITNLKTQTAIEYLVKMYINLRVRKTYGFINVRSLLLQVKALLYDLGFLHITHGTLYNLINQVVEWRRHWFDCQPSENEITSWIKNFHFELHDFLNYLFISKKFYANQTSTIRLAPHIKILPSDVVRCEHRGIRLPNLFNGFNKPYSIFLNRVNNFTFYFPVVTGNLPKIISQRFGFCRSAALRNRVKFPYFFPMFSHLKIY